MGDVERNIAAFLARSRKYKRPIDVTMPSKPKTIWRIASESRMAIDGDVCAYSMNWLMLPAYAVFKYHMLPRNIAKDPVRRTMTAVVIESEGRVAFSAIFPC